MNEYCLWFPQVFGFFLTSIAQMVTQVTLCLWFVSEFLFRSLLVAVVYRFYEANLLYFAVLVFLSAYLLNNKVNFNWSTTLFIR